MKVIEDMRFLHFELSLKNLSTTLLAKLTLL